MADIPEIVPSKHHAVINPIHHRIKLERAGMGPVGKINDWMATHLAILFGLAWTIWLFFSVPLFAPYLGAVIQGKIFYYASGWVQLFALPLMIYVGNKLQRSSDAQSNAMTLVMNHVATVEDQNKELLEQNTELTTAVHSLLVGQAGTVDKKGGGQ